MVAILHVTSGLGIGGAETMLVQVATRLQQRGHPQQVVSLGDRGELGDKLADAGIAVSGLGIRSPISLVPALWRLRRIVADFSPDVIQGWMYHGNIAATLAHLAVRGPRRRLYWNVRASNMDAARYRLIIEANARLSQIPDAVIFNSAAGVDFHAAQGFRPRRTEVIDNGIDSDRFLPDATLRAYLRAEFGISNEDLVVIHVARVDPMKDHSSFLRAVATVPRMQAILIGAGTEMLALPPNARALGLRRDVDRLYPLADIVASSSAFGEGFSNVLAEGMSAGLMPIATDVGDAARIVGDTGFVVPPADVSAFAAALSSAAGLTTVERMRRGRGARQRVVESFGMARALDAFERLYREGGC